MIDFHSMDIIRRLVLIGLLSSLLSACGGLATKASDAVALPPTPAERLSLYGYVPVDPLPVKSKSSFDDCPSNANASQWAPVRESLPDNAIRMAVRDLTASGELSVMASELGVEGRSYQVIIDYMNSDVVSVGFTISRMDADGNPVSIGAETYGETRYVVERLFEKTESDPSTEEYALPVYVGIGLRMTATVRVLKGRINLTSLGSLAAAAEAGRIEGSLVVQTLGISGQQVAGLLPLPSELNTTTIQNAIVALGSIKAIIHDSNTRVVPRVVGFYRSYGLANDRVLNAIVSELASARVTWWRSCSNTAT